MNLSPEYEDVAACRAGLKSVCENAREEAGGHGFSRAESEDKNTFFSNLLAFATAGLKPRPSGGDSRAVFARPLKIASTCVAAVFLVLSCSLPAQAWGGRVKLARKYRPGQRTVYQTTMQTRATVRSNPPGLTAFLPPMPTEFSTRQENTITVRAVHPDGAADVENRFGVFEFQSNLPDLLPEEVRDSARAAQEEVSKRLSGQALTARYDRTGRLLSLEGADDMLQDLDPPLRETARQALRQLLEQMGGHALYPDHRVKRGEEWKQKIDTPPTDAQPFTVEGESTLRFVGKTRYRGVKAAIIHFHFTNQLRPTLESLRQAGPLAQLETQGLGLDIGIDGQGQGRVLVALDDGRILQNHATLRQTLRARLKGASGVPLPAAGPVTLEVDSETQLEMDTAGERGR